MSDDWYEKGYKQASQDFAQGKGYIPHDPDNLLKLVFTRGKNTDAFMKGYKAGYDYCGQLQLRRYARESMQAWPGGGSKPMTSPGGPSPSPDFAAGFGDGPEDEPEYP